MRIPYAPLLLDGLRLDHAPYPLAHATKQKRPARDAEGMTRVPARVEAGAERARVCAPELVCAERVTWHSQGMKKKEAGETGLTRRKGTAIA